MDVILVKDVSQLGKEGAVVHVKDGFARNYLLPRGLALPATPDRVNAFAVRQQQAQRKVQQIRQVAETLRRQLEGRSFTLKLSLGEGDKPFGSITVHDVTQLLAQEGLPVEKHAIQLEDPIKALGIYEIPVRLHPEVTATIKIWVVKA